VVFWAIVQGICTSEAGLSSGKSNLTNENQGTLHGQINMSDVTTCFAYKQGPNNIDVNK